MSRFILLVLLVAIEASHHNDSIEIQPRRRFNSRGNLLKYLVSIRTREKIYNWGDNHFCSGALLTSRWVMTAAGCVTTSAGSVRRRTSRRNLIVVVYTPYRLRKPLDRNRIPVENVVYSNEQKICCQDLVLIKLTRPVSGNKNHVLRLPVREISDDWLCYSIGWGRLYHNGPIADVIIFRISKKVEDGHCKFACNKNHLFCMTSYSERNDVGQADMGSPVFCGGTIYGVASQYHSDRPRTSFVYASTYSHRHFIMRVLSATANPPPLTSWPFLSIVLAIAGLVCFLN
ncbi:uncharacterized protein Dana_GF27210, isoform A [Drosophila ananassae]|uniref:Uncharacterized protein, isoform A n=2 Tax=Drosophila ananassae TaxID=7217 RepID=A0A0P8XPN1_DROAN|nr:uncharacterized protein Dana_GF27210, isoform A [Drosophila ananassae]